MDKRGLHYLDTIKIYISELESELEELTGPETSLSSDHESNQYRLLTSLYDRLASEDVPQILFWHSLAQLQTESKT